jgi:sporulation protein YlmC with PRC-barrel domain
MSNSGTLVLASAIWEARRLLAGWPGPAEENVVQLHDQLFRTLSTPEVDDVLHDIAAGDEREPNLDESVADPPTGNRTLDGTGSGNTLSRLISNQREEPELSLSGARNGRRSNMARATAHPNHRCVSSNDVQGTEVYGADGKHVGEVDHLIIDKLSGRVGYAVISFGGFIGLGHSHYPIPWSALSYDTSLGGFRTNITEQQLKDMPQFSDDSWQDRNWETRTHQYYQARPYWEGTS